MSRERRDKVLWVDELLVQELFNGFPRSNILVLPVFPELPSGYQVLRVHHSFERRAFGFLVTHPSFDVVPDAEMSPNVVSALDFRRSNWYLNKPPAMDGNGSGALTSTPNRKLPQGGSSTAPAQGQPADNPFYSK